MVMDASYFADEPLRIGAGSHLLLDDDLVEDRWGLERVLHRPDKFLKNPILLRDKPWEGDVAYRPCVLYDEALGRYRMWYQCFSYANYYGAEGAAYYLAYAESEDGFTWEKPRLDVCPGYEQTNIVYCGHHYPRVQGVQVFIDDADADAARRYKMICVERRPIGGVLKSCVGLCTSPDGLRWQPAGDPILDYHSDCYNHVVRDESNGRWLLYCRPIHLFAAGRKIVDGQVGGRHRKRRIAAMCSSDFSNWSYPRTVLYPDERDTPDYDSASVFRMANRFLMLYAAMDGDGDGGNEVRLASSSDGLNWRRFHSRQAFLPRGRSGDWDAGQVIAEAPVAQGDDLLVYYSGFTEGQHAPGRNGGIGLARLKRDHFVEQRAVGDPGYLLTREFVLEGNKLALNTIMPGKPYTEQCIRVEIVQRPQLGQHGDETAHAVAGFSLADCNPLRGTRADNPVTWKGDADLNMLKGQPIYLRCEIRDMGVFSFHIAND
jgi:hypothetical protein